MAKEFTFQKTFIDGTTGHLNKPASSLAGTAAHLVNRSSEPRFSGACFTSDQNGGWRVRDSGHDIKNFTKCLVFPHHRRRLLD